MQINITAIIKSKSETVEYTKEILTKMAINSKNEKACIQYDLHQSIEEPTHFFFHEIWKNEEGLALHKTKSYIKNFVKQAEKILAETPEIYRTNKIA